MNKLSVVISTFNEEHTLEECLKSISDLSDEIIVVDHGSTDETVKIAKEFTKHIYHRTNDPSRIDLQKNFGFGKASGDWVFNLDADERFTKDLRDEIQEVLKEPQFTAYRVPRKNIIFGKWIEHSLWWPDYQIRLFEKGKGKYTEENVHKQLEVDGTIGQLQSPITHENYQTVSQYLRKMDVYTENEAMDIVKRGSHFLWTDALRLPVQDVLKTFFLQQGYKDGLHGLVLSTLQGFYTFLVVIKVWEKNGFKAENDTNFLKVVFREWKSLHKEIMYWFLTALSESSNPIKGSYYRLKRKLRS